MFNVLKIFPFVVNLSTSKVQLFSQILIAHVAG